MQSVIFLVNAIFEIYILIVVASVILSWLVSFNVLNPHNQFVRMIGEFLHRATEPLLGPIHRILPNLGPLDVSPIVLLLLLYFARILIIDDVLVRFL